MLNALQICAGQNRATLGKKIINSPTRFCSLCCFTRAILFPMATKKATRVLLIDDHPILRQGIAQLINTQPDFMVCGETDDARKVISSIQATKPDVIILDVSLKGASGIEALKGIKAQFPDIKVLVLSMHEESVYGSRALRAGAAGYVMKQEAPDTVLVALRKVVNGDVYLSPQLSARMLNTFAGNQSSALASPVDALSDRELEVFTLLGQGHGTREIAEKLHLSIKTIESHRAHIKEKLNLKNAMELTHHAIQWAQMESVAHPVGA
jgi:DNA-binding NarL/FixJ family response regulator